MPSPGSGVWALPQISWMALSVSSFWQTSSSLTIGLSVKWKSNDGDAPESLWAPVPSPLDRVTLSNPASRSDLTTICTFFRFYKCFYFFHVYVFNSNGHMEFAINLFILGWYVKDSKFMLISCVWVYLFNNHMEFAINIHPAVGID